jgi:hypothetical protein
MHDGPIELNIGNVCGGAVSELFEHEVARIMKNIGDVNTNPEEKRSLTLEFKFKPSPRPEECGCHSRLQIKSGWIEPCGWKRLYDQRTRDGPRLHRRSTAKQAVRCAACRNAATAVRGTLIGNIIARSRSRSGAQGIFTSRH